MQIIALCFTYEKKKYYDLSGHLVMFQNVNNAHVVSCTIALCGHIQTFQRRTYCWNSSLQRRGGRSQQQSAPSSPSGAALSLTQQSDSLSLPGTPLSNASAISRSSDASVSSASSTRALLSHPTHTSSASIVWRIREEVLLRVREVVLLAVRSCSWVRKSVECYQCSPFPLTPQLVLFEESGRRCFLGSGRVLEWGGVRSVINALLPAAFCYLST